MALLTQPYSGVGITLGYRTGSSGAYTSLVQLMDDAEFAGFENATIEIKPLASGVVTKVAGRTDSGSFTGSCYLVNADTGVAELFTLFNSKATVSWQVQLPDGSSATTGSTYVFSGFVGSLTPGNFTGEDAPNLSFEIPISGLVTITAGS
jgi:hypothetical protein